MNDLDIKVIASGSSGNCSIIDNKIMIDIGIKKKDRELLIPFLDDIKVIIITHRHTDHIQIPMMKWIIEEYPDITFMYIEDVRYFLDEKLIRKQKGETIPIEVPKEHILELNKLYNLGFVKFKTVGIEHDVPNIGLYMAFKNGDRLFYATDTHDLNNVRIPSKTNYIMIEHHHLDWHYDQIIEEKMNDESEPYIHELQAKNVHQSFEQANDFLLANKIKAATVYRMHMSSDEYYRDMDLIYEFKGE